MVKIVISALLFVSSISLARENGENKTLLIGTSEPSFYFDTSPGEHHYIDHTGKRPITNGRLIFHHVDVNNQGTNQATSFHEFAELYAGQFHIVQIAPGAFKDISIAAYKDIVNLLDDGGSLLCSPNYDPEILNHPNFYIYYKYSNNSLIKLLNNLAKNSKKNDLYVLRKITSF